MTALVGPNGSGKTTLLLILAGLLAPDEGTVRVAGVDLTSDSAAGRRRIGWMPDAFGTWDALTCTEILTVFGQAYGLEKVAARERAGALLAQLHLAEFAARPARVLSRGQKQRLGLARALVHDPDVLLLDEPASGLDPRSRVELRQVLASLASDGKTVLVSSHVLSELEEVYDHAVFLSGGRSIDASTTAASAGTTRGWRIDSLDPTALRTFLDNADIPWRPGATVGEVIVSLTGYSSAAGLLGAAVAAGVPIHTIAPMSGRLEETYLALNEDRT